ncbi:transcriptional regulator, XRE family [Ancylobacter novellus DSM 506]|uniref:Transcriptional regulator, XRE family n=1 Tax=Ancylobacter novellus (strain ATCC 8093 / DSM 506 / JCM 20403 / CCM 1077 / IAM 12100 / NBRC 12443 / NCIMB 10456) TaxID=639283 RepID=D7A368_ANCN5|nr:short-chain fatty acyl-CoA regulator family protein [Ancylobacter novellus]ADH87786.1 transcriptional regulator, XRE family [Ancylobacter novellus DSM 506]
MAGMSKKVFAGHAVRNVRERLGLTQIDFARRLSLSPSYINQIESNQRPVTAAVLLAISRTFDLDITRFGADDLDRIVADLREALADPVFRGLEPSLQDLKNATTHAPAFAHAFLRLHGALRRLDERRAALDDAVVSVAREVDGEARNPAPYEEVRDHFHYIDNYVDGLDRAAEERNAALDLFAREDAVAVLAQHLRQRHDIVVDMAPADALDAPLVAYDRHRRVATLSRTLDRASQAFRLAALIARFEQSDLIDQHVIDAGFRSATAREVCRLSLQNYYAGALMLPYRRFARLARERRHDLDILAAITGASLEQVCHRLSTLQRPGEKGVPFYFLKVDRAGNVIKRHSATRFQFARYGGACPVWNVHEAFEQPSRTLVQVGEMPDGVRYLCLARGTSKPATRYGARERRFALGIGCEISYAGELVYADGLDLKSAAVAPLGVNCRICPRASCPERAFPPLDREIVLDPDRRDVVPFSVRD